MSEIFLLLFFYLGKKFWLNMGWNNNEILLGQMIKQILCGEVMLKCQRN